MPDYSKGLIYTIKTGNSIYVGSTTNFTKRKWRHKKNIENDNTKLYQTIRENGGEWEMKPYKEFSCETKQQLNIEEERIRCDLKADLNMNSCYGCNVEQYKKNNKQNYYKKQDYYLNKSIEYYHTHIDEKKEYDKLYYQKKKEERNCKIKCEVCNSYFVAQGIRRHNKTKKHLDMLTKM
tara:strand:+ start:95 stop:631 length:537 start_codon:yes stop_codon:yes gene_type:complete